MIPFAEVVVVGGGITGQMVQWAVPEAQIFDWKPQPTALLTRNYGGNYLWEPILYARGVVCRKFQVKTHVDGKPGTRTSITRYKAKIGKVDEDSSNWNAQFRPDMMGWDFTEIPEPTIHYNKRIVYIKSNSRTIEFDDGQRINYGVLVSTIPLYSLLSLLNWEEPLGGLQFRPIYVRRVPFNDLPLEEKVRYPPNIYYVNYISDPDMLYYRYTDRDGERHYESLVPLPTPCHKLTPGKILDHSGTTAVIGALNDLGIYPFGRYGRWASNELVHETWADIRDWRKCLVP